jgi:DNA-binding SARP family transcriptional activator/Tfp pilus assembly protein PilF
LGLRLLGPPDLVVGGRSIDVGGPRSRTVLALLALNANRTTSIERLIDAVWEDSPPATARSQIQICVSGLRKLFDQAGLSWVIRSRHPGYALEIPPTELDVEEFARLTTLARKLTTEGRPADAAAALRNAQALWRGPALVGLPGAELHAEVARLEEQRMAGLEERIRLDLDLGRHDEIGGELRALVEQHPLRERLHGSLMLALYRSGRQADALEAYRAARDRLAGEIGVEPGPELRELHRRILERDPKLESHPTTPPADASGRDVPAGPATAWAAPRQLPAGLTDFTGRQEQLATIRRALAPEAGAPPYAVPVVGIFGPGGVGKTSLAIRVAHELTDAFPDGQLYVDLRTAHGDEAPARLLGRFLRSLGMTGFAIPDDVDERATMYRSLLAGKRVLVVLDGAVTEHQIELLLPGSAGCAVIATSRERLDNLPGLVPIDLDVFDAEVALDLIGKVAGRERIDAEPDAAAELVRFCDGLPLALRIASARLAGKRHWPVQELVGRLADEVHRLDELSHHGQELRSTIGFSYQGLDEQARRLFRLCALVPTPDFPAWVAAALLDTGVSAGVDQLENLVDAQLLTVVAYPDMRPRYRFHDLIRVYASERLAAAEPADDRQAALERMVSGWMAFVEDAHRLAFGGDFTTLHGTAPRWRPPDVTPAELIGTPYPWFERERRAVVAAIRQAAENGLDELCWDLALTSITLFERGHFDDWKESAEVGLRAVEAAGNRLGRAAMLHSLGSMHVARTKLDAAVHYATEAQQLYRELGNVRGLALSTRHLASAAEQRGDHEASARGYTEAGRLFRSVGDEIGYAQVIRSLAKYQIAKGDLGQARSMLEESLGIVRHYHDLRTEAMVLNRLGEVDSMVGEFEAAATGLGRALDIVREIDDRVGEAFVLFNIGKALHNQGQLMEAQVTLKEALEAASRFGDHQIMGHTWRQLGEIAAKTGETAEAVEHLNNAQRNYAQLGAEHLRSETLSLLEEIRTRMSKDE